MAIRFPPSTHTHTYIDLTKVYLHTLMLHDEKRFSRLPVRKRLLFNGVTVVIAERIKTCSRGGYVVYNNTVVT